MITFLEEIHMDAKCLFLSLLSELLFNAKDMVVLFFAT